MVEVLLLMFGPNLLEKRGDGLGIPVFCRFGVPESAPTPAGFRCPEKDIPAVRQAELFRTIADSAGQSFVHVARAVIYSAGSEAHGPDITGVRGR
jgi:hypothetical protein